MRRVLGIRYGHDASACLVVDGKIVVDVAEERFSRIKNDGSFPLNAVKFCLDYSGISSEEIDAIAEASVGVSNAVHSFFHAPEIAGPAAPTTRWRAFRDRFGSNRIKSPVEKAPVLPLYMKPFPLSPHCKIVPVHHHLAHAASAYYTSGLHHEKALIVTMDGRGDGVSVAIWRGERNLITPLRQWDGSSSLGWFYSCATEALGWRHGSDEWKVMGLAPYGEASPGALRSFHPEFKEGELVVPHRFGNADRWPDHGVNHYHMLDAHPLSEVVSQMGSENFAAEVQQVAESQAMEIIIPWLKRERTRHLCCAGGFFLNVKVNQELWYTGELGTHWIYPNPGDSGLAAGAALYAYYASHPDQRSEKLRTMYYGPEYSDKEIRELLDERKLSYEHHEDIATITARHLAENRIVGWFRGRMESGPRALGNRSILMSPLRAEHKDLINACVKYREAFRPFCPSILHEYRDEYLVGSRDEPFMITSFDVKPEKATRIPAVVHVDGTARPQTVRREDNPVYYDTIKAFGDLTGEYVVLNTSFNVKGEPIICHPREAIKCFFDTGIDLLVLGNFVLRKPS